MNKNDSIDTEEQDYAIKGESSPFDRILPKKPVQTSSRPLRIHYKTRSGTNQIIFLANKNFYHEILFRACASAISSNQISNLSDNSKSSYCDAIRKLFDWINESGHITNDKNRYDVLKEYEACILNERRQSRSPLAPINAVLKAGMTCPKFTSEEHRYLQILLSLSTPTRAPEPEPVTLSNWFNFPESRKTIGENAYLQLESPRLLFRSFRVTIATTLIYLLEQRRHWQRSSPISFDTTYTNWQYTWNRLILERNGKFNDQGQPEDELSELLWIDLVTNPAQADLKAKLAISGTKNLPRKLGYQKNRFVPWQVPMFFHPDNQTRYSALEERLCSWLAACETIQPSDIQKLKISNYSRDCNSNGRLIAMECTYYKGRAGAFRQTAILMGSDVWTKALNFYMAGLAEPHLFRAPIGDQLAIPLGGKNTIVALLFKIWKLASFQKKLDVELRRAETTSLFLRAILSLADDDGNQILLENKKAKSSSDRRIYKSSPTPYRLFTLTHIKNTAVHAGTDIYRESDLINHHSHTALTEKTSYLTDSNKEWVNQAGRITRLVLHDLQNVVFRPSLTSIKQAVSDLELRTKICEATHLNNAATHSLEGPNILNDEGNSIIVTDTVDTAIYFIHYVTQAEMMLPRLVAVRPDWVERTLIVKVEWMTRTLIRLRSTASAQAVYPQLAEHLPPLFNHLFETTE